MTVTAHANGHKIHSYDGKNWYYMNGELFTKENYRPCPLCGHLPKNEQDYCIANLPGVKNACCGHGVHKGYIQFENGVMIEGKFKIKK